MLSIADRIRAGYQQDLQRSAEAVAATELPLSYEAITDHWLTNILCKDHPGARVISHVLGAPDTGSSNRRKIRVQYNSVGEHAGLPTALFCKATHDLTNRMMLGTSGGANSEVIFYNEIRPQLDIEAPTGFYARFDPETFNSMIILGDVSDTVTEFCSHDTLVTLERAQSQIRLLATVHGRFHESPEMQTVLSGLPTWTEHFGNGLSMGMKEGSNNGFLAAEEVIPPALYARFHEIWPATLASVEHHNHLPHTLTHGDVHLKNWYVAGNGEMALSDWQCCNRGHWGRDLAYTISTALTVEDRRAWEKDLLRLYLDRLQAAGVTGISFDEAWDHYRRQLMSALTWWTITLSPAPGMPDMQPRDTTLEFIHRIATAIDDLDSLAAIARL